MTMTNGNCIQKYGNSVRVAGKALCTGGPDEQWILDARGAIHSRSDLGLCLTDPGNSGGDVKLSACSATSDNQAWDTSTPKKITRGGRCMDLNTGKLGSDGTNRLIVYGCTGGANQQWSGLVNSNSLLMTLLSNDNLRLLATIPQK